VCDDQAAGDFFSLIDAHLDTISSSRDYRSLMALKSSPPETVIQFITQSNLPQPEYWLNEAEKVLATEPTMAGSLPSFSWHGSQNRFHKWITHFVTGNWGTSIVDGRPVISKIWSALVWTLGLSFMTIIAGLGLSFLAAIFGLKKEGSLGQRAVHTALMALYAMPLFWIATIAIVFLTTPQYSAWLNIFPSVGIFNPPSSAGFGRTLIELISFIFLPMLCMVLSGMAFLYLQWLENGREVRSKPFVITAKSKGLNLDQVVRHHIMPNASIPVIGLIGLMLPAVISGSVIIEVLFNIPGMGRLIFTSVMTQDWNIVFAVVFITSVLSFLGLALSDLLMHYFDPKIRVDE
jgi:peptide/nickel transport system permease protein